MIVSNSETIYRHLKPPGADPPADDDFEGGPQGGPHQREGVQEAARILRQETQGGQALPQVRFKRDQERSVNLVTI